MKVFSKEFNKLNDTRKREILNEELRRTEQWMDKLKKLSRKLNTPGFVSIVDERPDVDYDKTQKE